MSVYGLCLAVVLVVTGCASPTQKIYDETRETGFHRQVLSGQRFDHLVLTRNIIDGADTDLHVYIEGDGSAWIANRWIAEDPTPRRPVALELMQLDPAPVLYLGRPCYFGLQRNCTPEDWTSARYSDAVVRAMAEALADARERLAWTGGIVLIGHSGGGVLAMLLAARVPGVDAVVTLAANLDTDAWTRLHRYSPLSGSLNPATEPPLPDTIRQYHLIGELDRNVPPRIAYPAVERQLDPTLLRYPEFDHTCCWTDTWPSLLTLLP